MKRLGLTLLVLLSLAPAAYAAGGSNPAKPDPRAPGLTGTQRLQALSTGTSTTPRCPESQFLLDPPVPDLVGLDRHGHARRVEGDPIVPGRQAREP